MLLHPPLVVVSRHVGVSRSPVLLISSRTSPPRCEALQDLKRDSISTFPRLKSRTSPNFSRDLLDARPTPSNQDSSLSSRRSAETREMLSRFSACWSNPAAYLPRLTVDGLNAPDCRCQPSLSPRNRVYESIPFRRRKGDPRTRRYTRGPFGGLDWSLLTTRPVIFTPPRPGRMI